MANSIGSHFCFRLMVGALGVNDLVFPMKRPVVRNDNVRSQDQRVPNGALRTLHVAPPTLNRNYAA